MARHRHIPTRITAIGGLVQALEELGLRNVELHEQPEPLLDWIGRPTGELAHGIVTECLQTHAGPGELTSQPCA